MNYRFSFIFAIDYVQIPELAATETIADGEELI